MKVKFMLDEGAYAPIKAHKCDAGFDLRTPVDFYIPPQGRILVDLGVHCLIEEGHVGYIKSKSSLMKRGIIADGTIDAGYTGGIVACLFNLSDHVQKFEVGEKVTQLVISPIDDIELVEDSNFGETERGDNGFGSSGR